MKRTRAHAFTLTELLIAVGIATGIIVALFAAFALAADRARANALIRKAREYQNFIRAAVDEQVIPSPPPSTRFFPDAPPPLTGAYLPTLAPAQTDGALSYEPVLLAEHLVESLQPPSYSGRANTPPTWTEYIRWDATTHAFTADTMPAAEKTNMTATPYSAVDWPRIECALTSASPPSTALGTNFRLSPGVDLPANRRVIAWRLPNCTQAFAEALAAAANPPDYRPARGAACDFGPVAYSAPTNGYTTVYLYIIHL